MQPFRIVGTRFGSEHESAITLLASSEQDAKAQAYALGITARQVIACELLAPQRRRDRRRVQPASGRGVIRLIVGISALLIMLPGALAFAVLAISFIVGVLNAAMANENAGEVAMQTLASSALLPFSVLSMLGGGLLFLVLYIEDHAFDIRRVVNDGL
jgi:hypothetical protein